MNPPPDPPRPSGLGLHLLLQGAAAALLFRLRAETRLLDPDEGHFLSAIRCVYRGLAPCQDFFYQQTPLFPYPSALAMKHLGYGYETCLWVSVLCGAGLAVLTAAWFARRGGSRAAGWIGWLLVVANAPILFWTPTVKNHSMPLFFGALALFAAGRAGGGPARAFAWGALSGFAAVFSIGTRLLAAPFAAAAGGWILFRALRKERPVGAGWALLGFVLGAVPPLLLALRSVFPDPWVFWFDNVGFHLVRSGPRGAFTALGAAAKEAAFMAGQVQFPFIAGLAVASAAAAVWRRRAPPDPVPGAGALPDGGPRNGGPGKAGRVEIGLFLGGLFAALLALLPAETFHQYFLVPFVFFLWASVPAWGWLLGLARDAADDGPNGIGAAPPPSPGLPFPTNPQPFVMGGRASWRAFRSTAQGDRTARPEPVRLAPLAQGPEPVEGNRPPDNGRQWVRWVRTGWARAALALLLAGYGALSFHHREWTDREFPQEYGRREVLEMAEALRAATPPGARVFSTWQGFTFLADRDDLEGNENFNARTVSGAGRVDDAALRRLRISTTADLIAAVRARAEPEALAIGFFPFYNRVLYDPISTNTNRVIHPDIANRYRLVKVMGRHQLWVRRRETPEADR